jgi:redox-sensitive bicupin YhaK (pirin superfamily)
VDVRPHPHIGLATVTYLFQGEFQHRDSLGTDQIIHPGAVNWMIAGKGVTHSERTSAATRTHPHSLFGIQTWVALPEKAEDGAAGFEHQGKEALPLIEAEGAKARLILGEAWGKRAPVSVFNEMFYADVELAPGAKAPLPDGHEDRGLYIVSGSLTVGGQSFEAARMMVFRPGDRLHVTAGPMGARLILLGGETLPGPRFIWWNFVASSRERIEAAKEAWRAGDWEHGRFQLPAGDDAEFIPLPEEAAAARPREVR